MKLTHHGLGIIQASDLQKSLGAYLTRTVRDGINIRVVSYGSVPEYMEALDEVETELREMNNGGPVREWSTLLGIVDVV